MKTPGYTVGYHDTPPTYPDDYLPMQQYQRQKMRIRKLRKQGTFTL